MINDNVVDDSNLAQCRSCGFVDDWDEIPKGHCWASGDSLTECPGCGDVDGFSDYDPAKAIIRNLPMKLRKLSEAEIEELGIQAFGNLYYYYPD